MMFQSAPTVRMANKPETMGSLLKRAFFWHWHLLALGAAIGFALVTGPAASALLPLVVAGELAYLGFLGLNPRFQKVLRGKEMMATTVTEPNPTQQINELMAFLVPEDRDRFTYLQNRCLNLLNLRRQMDRKSSADGSEDFRAESLDRMLWLFLKLLHQRSGLERFLNSTNRAGIEWEQNAADEQLKRSIAKDEATGSESRLTVSVRDRLNTIKERLANYDKAAASRELVAAEIDKTEQQITHLVEVGMTTRDSANLTAQIDGISASLQASEAAFHPIELDGILSDQFTPPLLSSGRGLEITEP